MNEVFIPPNKGMKTILASSIIRVDANSKYSRIYCNNACPLTVATALQWFEEKLQDNFFRIHKSDLVNGLFIAAVSTDRNSLTVSTSATGTATYTFRNYGGETQNNVNFKISSTTAGYTITSADSVNVGNILPGQSKQVSFNFQSPANDSVGDYTITVKAANGMVKPLSGLFYAIDPTKFYSVKNGNWNDPATWSSNTVPAAINKVYISHTVTVAADSNCKSVTVYKPGGVTVNTGRRIIIHN